MHSPNLLICAKVTTTNYLWLVFMFVLLSLNTKAQFYLYDSNQNDQCIQIVGSADYIFQACNIKGAITINDSIINEPGENGFLILQYDTQTGGLLNFRFFNADSEVEITKLSKAGNDEILMAGRFFGQIQLDGISLDAVTGQSALFTAKLDDNLQLTDLVAIQGSGFKSIGDILHHQNAVYICINFTQNLWIDTTELANVSQASTLMLKLNNNLQYLAAHLISGSNSLQGNGLAWNGSNLLLAGTYRGNFVHGSDTLPSFTSHSNAFILAFDPLLLPVYSQSLRGVFDDAAIGIVAKQNLYYVFGNYSGVLHLSSDVSIESTDNFTDVWLAAYDSSAQLLWHRTFNGPFQNQATSLSIGNDYLAISGQYLQQIGSGGLSLIAPTDGSTLAFTALVNFDGSVAGLTSTIGSGVHFIFSSLFMDSIFCLSGAFNGVWVYSGQQYSGNQYAGFFQCSHVNLYTTITHLNLTKTPIHIWPVPANEVLNIYAATETNFRYEVFDLNGQSLISGNCVKFNEFCTFNIDMLTSGAYVIRMWGQNFSVSIPFIKL